MLDAISEQIAQRTAQIVLAHLAPVIQPQPVEDGQIVGVAALARYLECDRGRNDYFVSHRRQSPHMSPISQIAKARHSFRSSLSRAISECSNAFSARSCSTGVTSSPRHRPQRTHQDLRGCR